MKKINVIIIDDEKRAREGIKILLENHDDVVVQCACKDGLEAIRAIEMRRPELIILDIQMPGITGFDVLNNVEASILPQVIFCTAYDQYALKAFEVHALDYLLKPFTNERFHQAINYAKKQLYAQNEGAAKNKVQSLLKEYDEQIKAQNTQIIYHQEKDLAAQLIIKSSGKVFFLKLADIYYFEALDSYIKIHLRNECYIVKESLKTIEQRFGGGLFVRIHRSFIVSLNKIKSIEPYLSGDFFIQLDNNKTIRGSRNFRTHLKAYIG